MNEQKVDKRISFEIQSYLRGVSSGKYLLNHPLQRASGQWTAIEKGNLIRRIIQGDNIPAIKICEQIDAKTNMKKMYVVDGKQRTTVIEEYIHNGFAINKKIIDYIVEYDGVVYEQKETKNGVYALKRTKHGDPIPALNEDGESYSKHQTIDIRGLKFKDLPPELQDIILCHQLAADMSCNCSARDVQIEILDLNSGKKMNKAQIGMTALSADWAKYIVELSKHPFIKEKCGFTPKNETQGFVTKSIGEALMLVNYYDYWLKDYQELCRFLSDGNLSLEHVNKMSKMFDVLYECVSDSEEIKKLMIPKNFFLFVYHFSEFLSKGYEVKCYGMFLDKFVTELSFKKIVPGEDEEGESILESYNDVDTRLRGNKASSSIEERLDILNQLLDEFLKEHCIGMESDEDIFDDLIVEDVLSTNKSEYDETCDDVFDDLVELELDREIFQNISVVEDVSIEDSIIACNMVISRFPQKSLDKNTMKSFCAWSKEEMCDTDEYIRVMDDAEDILLECMKVDDTINTKTLPVFIMLFNHSNKEDFEEWIVSYMLNDEHPELELDCTLNNENLVGVYSKLNASLKMFVEMKGENV